MYDFVIIGSGPAGVSAAYPLLESGKSVVMLDWGNCSQNAPINEPQYSLRRSDEKQWKWMLGENFHALKHADAVSPKLRIPHLKHVFADFRHFVDMKTHNFFIAGSMALGGLSNAWGAGVAALDGSELIKQFGEHYRDMMDSYACVSKRVGISGRKEDELKYYFGVDKYIDEGISLDPIPFYLSSKHDALSPQHRNIKIGRSRIAVFNRSDSRRKACDKLGNCLWGCSRQSIYSAKYDIEKLLSYPNFTLLTGHKVTKLINDDIGVKIEATLRSGKKVDLFAKSVFLGAGTLSSTKILVNSLGIRNAKIDLLSCPTAAFLLFIPKFFGRRVEQPEFGLGQLSFNVSSEKVKGFGSFFSTQGLPLYEFSRHVPLGISNGMHFLSRLMSSCLVGNVFLPGSLSRSTINVGNCGELEVQGAYDERYKVIGKDIEKKIKSHFRKLNAFVVPFSFKFTEPGACIHYASTFPIRNSPGIGECDMSGKVKGMDNVYLIDGASLPTLTEKSHTLTIMANSDRIAKGYIKNNL